jgi:hypothetical protein
MIGSEKYFFGLLAVRFTNLTKIEGHFTCIY